MARKNASFDDQYFLKHGMPSGEHYFHNLVSSDLYPHLLSLQWYPKKPDVAERSNQIKQRFLDGTRSFILSLQGHKLVPRLLEFQNTAESLDFSDVNAVGAFVKSLEGIKEYRDKKILEHYERLERPEYRQ